MKRMMRILVLMVVAVLVGSANAAHAHTTFQAPVVTITAEDKSVVESAARSIAADEKYTLRLPKTPSNIIEKSGPYGCGSFTMSATETTLVTVSAEVDRTLEGTGHPAVFLIKRTGSVSSDLNVSYQIGGSGTNGVDYDRLPAMIKTPAGQDSARVGVNALRDDQEEAPETVTITILTSVAVIPERSYQAGAQSTATVTILDTTKEASTTRRKKKH